MYFRRWSAVAKHNHWRMVKGRLDPEAVLSGSEAHEHVAAAAHIRARREHRGVTADDLRHGCHVVALRGRDKSHTQFANRDFDALLVLWGDDQTITGLLLAPADLAATMHLQNPELKTRERYLHWLRTECLAGYVASESARIHGTQDWETLPDAQLAGLHNHLRNRPAAQNAPGERLATPDSRQPKTL